MQVGISGLTHFQCEKNRKCSNVSTHVIQNSLPLWYRFQWKGTCRGSRRMQSVLEATFSTSCCCNCPKSDGAFLNLAESISEMQHVCSAFFQRTSYIQNYRASFEDMVYFVVIPVAAGYFNICTSWVQWRCLKIEATTLPFFFWCWFDAVISEHCSDLTPFSWWGISVLKPPHSWSAFNIPLPCPPLHLCIYSETFSLSPTSWPAL